MAGKANNMEKMAERVAAKMAAFAQGRDLEDFDTLCEFDQMLWQEIDSQNEFPRSMFRKAIMQNLSGKINL